MRFFPPDHAVFADEQYRNNTSLSDEDREAHFAWLATLPAELLDLLEGDRGTLDLLLRFQAGEMSCRQLAGALGVSPSTITRRLQLRLEKCRWVRAADLAVACFCRSEGFAIDLHRGVLLPLEIKEGYAVRLADTRVFARMPSREDIKKFLRDHAHLLRDDSQKFYFGGSIHRGYRLDLTVIRHSLRAAISLAIAGGHTAICDMRSGELIILDEAQRSAA